MTVIAMPSNTINFSEKDAALLAVRQVDMPAKSNESYGGVSDRLLLSSEAVVTTKGKSRSHRIGKTKGDFGVRSNVNVSPHLA